jgi:hypothetical protein
MNGKWRMLTTSLVLQVFWDDNASMVKNAVFPGGSSLSAQTYSSLADVQKFITLRSFIVSGCVNNRWKEERVFYNYCIGIMVIFSAERFQIWYFLAASCDQVWIDVNNQNFCLEVVSGFKHRLLHVMLIGFYSPKPKLIIWWNIISFPCLSDLYSESLFLRTLMEDW